MGARVKGQLLTLPSWLSRKGLTIQLWEYSWLAVNPDWTALIRLHYQFDRKKRVDTNQHCLGFGLAVQHSRGQMGSGSQVLN